MRRMHCSKCSPLGVEYTLHQARWIEEGRLLALKVGLRNLGSELLHDYVPLLYTCVETSDGRFAKACLVDTLPDQLSVVHLPPGGEALGHLCFRFPSPVAPGEPLWLVIRDDLLRQPVRLPVFEPVTIYKEQI